jgi:hypothetical protein
LYVDKLHCSRRCWWLTDFMQMGFDDFGRINERLPERVIFFRDGISEGQYDGIATEEMNAIRSTVSELRRTIPSDASTEAWDRIIIERKIQNPPKFRLTFIIVEKR